MESQDNIIYLTDDSGEEVPFELLDTIAYEGNEYAVLMTIDPEPSDEGDIVILKMENSENSCEVMLVSIEDDTLEDRIFEIFEKQHPDEFDFSAL